MENDEVKTMFAHTLNDNIKWTLRIAYKKNKTNIGKIENLTKDGETIIIPGKVLGNGVLTHKLNVASFSMSVPALKKILDAGGKVITLNDFVNQYPDGKGVRIIG